MSLQEDAKTMLPYIQAMADGKTVQWRSRHDIEWSDKRQAGEWCLGRHEYRIKPEKKWRPYTREEWERVDKVRCKSNECVYAVGAVYLERVSIIHCGTNSFDDMLHQFTNLDGTPCGVEVEE